MNVAHHSVNLAAGIRVDGPWHVQNVHAYDSRSKGGCTTSKAFRRATLIPASAGSEPSSGHPEKPCHPLPFSPRRLWHEGISSFATLSKN
jgi:hypothetical protein